MGRRSNSGARQRRPVVVRAALGVGRGIGRTIVAVLALVLLLAGVYAVDVLASERLVPTVAPWARVPAGSQPCAEASLALVTASGAGRQTSHEMGDLLTGIAADHDACVVVLDYGSVMNTRGNVDAVLAAALAGRPDGAGPLALVLLGNSMGGIEVQRMANVLQTRETARVRVLSVVADSTPSGAADLKPPLTQDLADNCGVPLGHFLGQNIVRLWQAYEEAARRNEDLRDAEVQQRIQLNTEKMQARLTMSQMCLIREGYPRQNAATPARGVQHVYVRPADEDADEVVRDAAAAAAIDRALGGGLRIVQVPGGIHAAAYLMWPTYEPYYREIVRQAWIELHPPQSDTRRARPV
jgi:thioesterase domain-containing protein